MVPRGVRGERRAEERRQLPRRGAQLLNAPKDYPYGMRDFDVADLDGNQLCSGMESKR